MLRVNFSTLRTIRQAKNPIQEAGKWVWKSHLCAIIKISEQRNLFTLSPDLSFSVHHIRAGWMPVDACYTKVFTYLHFTLLSIFKSVAFW